MSRLTAVAFLLAGCQVGAPPPAHPEPPVCSAQHSWADYHLPHDALSAVVRDGSSYTPDLDAWNDLGTPIQLRGAGVGFTLAVVDGGDENSGWLGLASITADSGHHIVSATVQMNRTILQRYSPSVARHVLCQELGHLLGLDHQRDALDSCMQDCAGLHGPDWLGCLSEPAGETPNAHDGEQLNAIYAHAVDDSPPDLGCQGELIIHALECPDGVCP